MCPHCAHPQRSTHLQHQRGAVLLIMLVIMIMGAMAFLVSELSKANLQIDRNIKSSDLLAQAKEVVIGYAISGGSRPGDLPYQDRLVTPTESGGSPNYDGNQDLCPGLTGCLGRLPWRTLGMSINSPSENDPTGYMPWYAVSANLVDPTGVVLNSELLNSAPPPHPWLIVRDMNGNVLSNRVAFVIIIPGAPINGQSRPSSPNLGGADQYLDSITVPAGCVAPCTPGITYSNADMDDDFIMGEEHRWIDDPANPGKKIEDSTYYFNDKLIYVTIDELMPLIEKRIAREVKSCLDDYASAPGNTNNRYPWAASATDLTAYPDRTGAYGVDFGRIPDTPVNTSTASGGTPPTGTLLAYIQAVQTALNNYLAHPTSGTLSNLQNRGDTLKDYAASGTPANIAGVTADNCTGMSCTSTLQSQLYTAMGISSPDSTMPVSWTANCTLFTTSSYWPNWRDLVFYQVAEGYHPGGGMFTPLQINGSGNPNSGSGTSYRAAVIVAGKKLGTQARPSSSSPPNNYLANTVIPEQSADPAFVTNAHNDAGSATSFITYKPSDPYYQSVNDLVLCLDGKINCK